METNCNESKRMHIDECNNIVNEIVTKKKNLFHFNCLTLDWNH